MYPMSNKLLYDFPTSDIGYPIESARRMAWYKLYITPLLPTGYSFDVGRGQADYWSDSYSRYAYQFNIHSMYRWVRRIADQLFIRGMQGLGGLLTEYLFGVCIGQVDYRQNVY